MRIGYIVEYFDEGQIGVGFVLAVETTGSGNKTRESYRILTEKNRATNIPSAKVVSSEPAPFSERNDQAAIAARLGAIRDTRKTLATGVPLAEIWELLSAEGEKAWDAREIATTYYGASAAADQVSAVTRSLYAKNPYFKRKDDYFIACSPEESARLIEQARREAEAREAEARFVSATLSLVKKGYPAEEAAAYRGEFASRITTMLESFVHPDNNAAISKTKDMAKSVADALKGRFDPFDHLAGLGVISRHENFLLRRHSVKKGFTPELEAEVARLAAEFTAAKFETAGYEETVAAIAGGNKPGIREGVRVDMTGINSYTVDGEDTACCDDGFSFTRLGGRMVVSIHIADAAHFIREGTPLDREAYSRATSIYMAEGKIDMFPGSFSTGLGNLSAGEVRPALSLICVFGEDLSPAGHAFVPALVKVTKKCTYGEFKKLFEMASGGGEGYAPIDGIHLSGADAADLSKLAAALREAREKNGAMTLFFPKADLHVDLGPDGDASMTIASDDNGRAGEFVSELMVLYNSLAAAELSKAGACVNFKHSGVYGAPELIREYREAVPAGGYDPLRAWEIKRSMPYAASSYEMQPHGMLGVAGYAQVSSPLRRYIDIISQRQLHSVAVSGKPFYTPERVKELVMYCDGPLAAASEIEQESWAYWFNTYLRDTEGPFPACVIEANDERFRLELSGLYFHLFGNARLHGRFTAGERVMVNIEGVDCREHRIHFSVYRPRVE